MANHVAQEAVVESRLAQATAGRAITSERGLIRAARRGDPDAAEALARRWWDEAHHVAHLIVRDSGAAEDIAQESILRALGSLGRFDLRRRPRPWLHRIVVNRAIDSLRERERRAEVPIDADAAQSTAAGEAVASGSIGVALMSIDAKTRAIVVLRCLFDYRAREIARMLDTTPGAVRTRLHRGLNELRDRLDEEGT